MTAVTSLKPKTLDATDIDAMMMEIGRNAKAAAHKLGLATAAQKDTALAKAAAAIRANSAEILGANAEDVADAKKKNLAEPMIDRLALDGDRVETMAVGLENIAKFPDPVGRELDRRERPNGLVILRISVPLGVIGIIYESRPNVTADAGGLCLKSGNAAILRSGSESFRSSSTILACLQTGLREAGLPEAAIQSIPTTDRAAVGKLLTMTGLVDVIVPRGGKSLVDRVQREARVPVFAHLEGICHTYVHADADPDMARAITVNAKMRRTSICGATETLLVDRAALKDLLPALIADLTKAGCEVRGDAEVQAVDATVTAASEEDWTTEYLAPIISVRLVDGVDQAIDHVNRYGSGHTDAIITGDEEAAKAFLDRVDSAIVLHNASTQFADGGEFGMGAEIGISTGKLHARGPVGAEQLTTFKYLVLGSGQTRP
ncbi:MAG: glutamate-5-semialdehyde dehydrogenase [Alphaproteobacteria bacterium]|nr:glutamate-5-semialdehyde dehydrogenase [Alphaproteobacteria bacterium]